MILISQHPVDFANFFTRFYKQDINRGVGVVNSGLDLHFKPTCHCEVRSNRKEKSAYEQFAIASYPAMTHGY